MKNNKNIFAMCLLLFVLVNMAIQYLSNTWLQSYLLNADELYLPTLFADIFSKNGHISDWYLTPAPYFFPDYFMFMLAYLFGSTAYLQVMIYALIQIISLLMALWFLIKQIPHSSPLLTASMILTVFLWLALSVGQPFVYILNSAFHYGIFLVSVIFIAIWIKFTNQEIKGRAIYFLMAMIAFLSSLSDQLFLVQVIAPLMVLHLLMMVIKRDFSLKKQKLLILIIIGSVIGTISYGWIVAHPTRYATHISTAQLISNITYIGHIFYTSSREQPILGLIFLFYIGIVMNVFIHFKAYQKEDAHRYWLVIFSFLSVCTSIVLVSLVSSVVISDRYLISVLSWPVVVTFIVFQKRLILLMMTLFALFSISFNSYYLVKNHQIKTTYYPQIVSCMDDILEKEGVEQGVTGYWDAKYIQNFSRLSLNIAQYSDYLTEMPWITSQKYFKPYYDFAIISKQKYTDFKRLSDILVRINGKPRSVFSCEDRVIYVYGKNNMHIKKIVNVGDQYTWKACELPTSVGQKTKYCEIQTKNHVEAGYLTFGPYEPLDPGQYDFQIVYSSTVAMQNVVGDWDVVWGSKLFNHGSIMGTQGKIKKIIGKFTLSSKQTSGGIEIRTRVKPNANLKIKSIRIIRVQ